MTSAGLSTTRKDVVDVVVNPGNTPESPAPAHVTDHRTSAETAYASSGWPVEDERYTWPQSGEASSG
ncbi:hypothetical protein ACTWP5_30860 [Streptomyces sp. 4N509B]|uniref:hypothetical protein n=1 Tax=Streptomyces sp. 4N509B TaxID=3457413 RepID=UPI003FD3F713